MQTYFHWLWDNKSQGHTSALFQRKNGESGIAQTLPISVSVKSSHRLHKAGKSDESNEIVY